MVGKPLPNDDLEATVAEAHDGFAALRGVRIFVTGGTGFFGHWLLESLLKANRVLGLSVQATVLTRDAKAFAAASPWIAGDAAITLLEGDVCGFPFAAGGFTHVVHAATDSGGAQQRPPGAMATSVIEGTRRVLSMARACGAERLLYVSTGAVYGRSTTVTAVPEEFPAAVLLLGSYEAGKQMAESLVLQEPALQAVIARPFAFVGPGLPLDAHFAIGNFIGSALRGETICVSGDGTPRRSWMYMSDLAAWLWTMLSLGERGRAYNVGSDEAYSIAEAANLTAATLAPGATVEIAGAPVAGAALNSYVPSVERARVELGLRVTVPLREALRRTALWHQ